MPRHRPPGFRYSMLIVAPAIAGLIVAGRPADPRAPAAQLRPGRRRDAARVRRPAGPLDGRGAAGQLLAAGPVRARPRPPRQRPGAAAAGPPHRAHRAGRSPARLRRCGRRRLHRPGPLRHRALPRRGPEGRWAFARTLASDGGRLTAFAAASFGGAALVAALLADGLAESLLAGALGCALYAGCLLLAVPRLVGVLLGAIRKAPRVDQAGEVPGPASSSISAR